MKLVSFDLQADFGFFRKPETNATINLSYNMIHKPAVLGILGAILGLGGYEEKGKLPEYYEKLQGLKIAISPLMHENGNFHKINIKYSNTVGYANKGTNFLTEELTLINPSYRIYILIDDANLLHQKLAEYLQKGKSEFVPYFGKNEFTAWWNIQTYKEYSFSEKPVNSDESIKITSIFEKKINLKDNAGEPFPDLMNFDANEDYFLYFERLPRDFNLDLMQYDLAEFAFSNYRIKNAHGLENLLFLKETGAYVELY